MQHEEQHWSEPLAEGQRPLAGTSEGQPSYGRGTRKTSPWLWIGLTAGALGMCVICGGVLTLIGVIGALSEDEPMRTPAGAYYAPYGQAAPHAPRGFPSSEFQGGAGVPTMPYGGYYSSPDMGSYPSLSDGDGGLSDSIRQQAAERSWWSEEWSRALGDNYPEPTHVDPDGNPGWIDHSGAFHDYNSGMSDYESSTLSGSGGE